MQAGHVESRKRTQISFRKVRKLLQHGAVLLVVALAPVLLLSGCSGLVSANASKSPPPPQTAIQVTPTSLNFGNLVVGKKTSQAASVANTGNVPVSISTASVSSSQFSVSGLAMPISLPAGQASTFQVWFDPNAAGNATGTLTLQTNNGVSSGPVALTGSATAAPQQIGVSSTSLNLGSATVGTTAKGTLTITNAGGANLILSFISVSGGPFGVSGITTPSTIAPGGSAMLTVSYSPTTAGNDSGSITITSNDPQTPTTIITLTGTGTFTPVAPTITTQPVNQTVTAGHTATFTVVAGGTAPLSYQWQKNGANITGASSASYTTPATTTSDSGSTFRVVVSNTAGTVTSAAATLTVNPATLVSIAVTPANPSIAKGATQQFTATGTFSNSSTQVLSNAVWASGTATVATISNTGLATTVGTGTSTISATSGSISGSTLLTVTPAPAPGIQVSPTSINFGNGVVGSTLSQVLIITNTGTATLSITQVTETGSAFFTVSGFSLPLNVNAGQQTTITVAFLPTSVGSASGSISIVSNAPTSPTSVGLSGTGIAATLTLNISPTSLSFGSITTGTSSAPQTVTITNTGNSKVTISQISASGAGYSITGGGAPVTLSPSQTLTLTALFSPTATGSVSGSISIVSNANGSPASVTLSGTGVAPVQHSVALSWNASTSTVSGYNVYRSTVSGSGYTKLNSSLVSGLAYTDSSVQNGTTYFYVTTAVDSSGSESVNSNQVSATIP